MLQTVRGENVDEKIGVICLVSMFHSWVMVCKLSKKVQFLQFCADLSKKSKSVEAIYIYASESFHYILSENAMIYRGLSQKKMLTWQKFLKNSSTSNTHTIETVSHSIINNINFWKCVTRLFRCMYVSCFNRLRFLAEVRTNLQKMYFVDNLRTITQEGSMETRQMTPFFSSTFSNLFVIFISEFENAQNSFSCGPPFGPF